MAEHEINYIISGVGAQEKIKCLRCGLTSFHPQDIEKRYCANCKIFHHDPAPTPDLAAEVERLRVALRSIVGACQRRLAEPVTTTTEPPRRRTSLDCADTGALVAICTIAEAALEPEIAGPKQGGDAGV